MVTHYKTGYFKIEKIFIPHYGLDSNNRFVSYHTRYVVKRLHWWFWWKTERYWRPKNDRPGNWVTYKFKTEKEALSYINRLCGYTTKVLWTTV